MHELSIAMAIVDSVDELAAERGHATVEEVRLRLGRLAGVHADALDFAFSVAREGTALANARLAVEHVPAVAHCTACARDFTVPMLVDLRCADCGQAADGLLSGRELEIEAVVFSETPALAHGDERKVIGDVPSR
ncbi:hydrogenase maturation nickel metallochaperone HypA [Yinghuangia sp. ASG 101]|uniref:hydrogenase maturation nickel metallochaperone HypA/HybF n=1 Tax=Yinghuangia sp. ASG 101 TaxID=2896848 RepID=UPI001E415BFB|nr:hydrogenase maturation nickel metallochaperone HypA [Yinghuangia sp. ASG 101]UGQ11502.1 hydrogenase maturation nickel metallochaperone HypA [Yinghuangia sp. ASG 101]